MEGEAPNHFTLPEPAILQCFPPIPLTDLKLLGSKVTKSSLSEVTLMLAPESQITLKHCLGSLRVEETLKTLFSCFASPAEAVIKDKTLSRGLLGSLAMLFMSSF